MMTLGQAIRDAARVLGLLLAIVGAVPMTADPIAADPIAVDPMAVDPMAVGQESFRLVSAQTVKASDDRPPLLRLAANGPIAFQLLAPEESGLPADSPRLAVRLFGVRPGEAATLEGLAPFSLVATPAENGALLLVTLAGLTPGAHLRVRAGQRANELEIVAAAAPAQY